MRAIDERELIRRISELPDLRTFSTATIGKCIKDCRTVTIDDLRPKGRWNIVDFDKAAARITIECSTCGMVEEMSLTAYALGHNFCHSCGADMQGGAND